MSSDIKTYLKSVVAGQSPQPASFAWVLEARAPGGAVLCREETYRVPVATGWQCGHAVWTPEEAEDRREEQGVRRLTDVTCEWCIYTNATLDNIAAQGTPTTSDRYDPKLWLCHYIECESCEERVALENATFHLSGGCSL